MKKGEVIVFIVFLLVLATVNAAEVENIVEDILETDGEVSVIIELKDKEVSPIKTNSIKENKELKKKKNEEQQDKVIYSVQVSRQVAGAGVGIKTVKRKDNFKLKHKYSTVNAISGKVNKEGLEVLKQDPNVKKIYFDRLMHTTLDDSIGQVNADDVWNIALNDTNITGLGETICIVDTGIDTDHDAFTGRIIGQYCYCGLDGCCPDGTDEDDDAEDDYGHGTHCAGIAAGNYSNYIGVAPKANIVAIKACNSSGTCATSDVIKAVDWCTNNASTYNISVISMSLGGGGPYNSYCNDDLIAPSIDAAVAENILVAVASGNSDWTNGISSPACVENATPVGGVDKSDNIDYNRGNILKILAPGVSITSAWSNGGTIAASGTSMATPHVAGAAALLFQFKKLDNGTTLTPQEIEDILNNTGTSIDDSGGSGLSFSRIDVLAAVRSLDTQLPKGYNNQTNNTAPKFNQTVQFNTSFNDTIGLSAFMFSWNDTGEWINKTNGSLSGNLQTVSLNETVTATRGMVIYWKFYFNDTNDNWNETDEWSFTVQNTNPTVTLLAPAEGDVFTQNNPSINYSCTDVDNDVCTFYTFINDTLNTTSTENITSLTFDQGNYTLAVMVDDGFANSSNSTNISFSIDNLISNDFTSNCTNSTKKTETIYWSAVFNSSGAAQYWLMYSQDVSSDDWTNTSSLDYVIGENITVNITINATRSKDVNATFFFNDSSGNVEQTGYIGCTVNNTAPFSNFSITLNSPASVSDDLNGTISKYGDEDGDTWTTNETRWYVNDVLNSSYDNITNISNDNTTANDVWVFSARVYDNFDWSEWVNSSTVTINDISAPVLVKNYTSPTSVNVNNALTIYLNITDSGSKVDNTTVKAEVEDTNTNKTNSTMKIHSGNNSAGLDTGWSVAYTPTVDGTYYIKYYFCDINNNCGNTSDRAVSFTATTATVETTSSSGGGSGGGGGGSSVSSDKTKSHFYTTIFKGDTTTMTINKEKIAVDKIIFTANNQLSGVTIEVKVLDNFSYELDNAYQYLNIESENLKNTDFDSAFIEFKVNKTWADKFDNLFLSHYFNDKWSKLKTDKLKEDNESVYYRSLTTGFSVFAITGEKEEVEEVVEIEEIVEEVEEAAEEEVMLAPERESKFNLKNFVVPLIMFVLFVVILVLVFRKRGRGKNDK